MNKKGLVIGLASVICISGIAGFLSGCNSETKKRSF